MSDVFDEIISRLKQKAVKQYKLHEMFEKTILTKEYRTRELWVRLEDVLSELKKLQENHIIIEKKKFKDEIVFGQLSTNAIINDLHEKIEEIIKNFVSFKASFIEELLKG